MQINLLLDLTRTRLKALTRLRDRCMLRLLRFPGDRRGVSTVEYALIIVAVIGVIVAVSAVLGTAFNDLFNDLSDELGNAVSDLNS